MSAGTVEVRTLARGGTLALAGVVASAALQFMLVFAVTRGLGAVGTGVFLEAVALFTIVGGLAQFGANTGLVRWLPRLQVLGRTAELRRTVVVAVVPVLVLSSVAATAIFVLAPQLVSLLFHGADAQAAGASIRIFAAVLPLAAPTIVILSGTRGLGSMLPYVAVQNVGLPALRFLLVLGFLAAGLGGAAVAAGWAVPAAAGFAAGAIWLLRLLPGRDAGTPAVPLRELASEFWRFSAARGLAGILGMTVTWVDVLLVGALRSTREAGIYAAASRLSIAGAYGLQAVGMAIAPRISALLTSGRPRPVEELYRLGTWWLMALTWPLYLTLIVWAPWVLGLFGSEFAAGRSAMVILSAAMLVNLATGNVTVVLLMSGRSALNLANAFASLVLNATLNLLLIPAHGMTGAAIAWAVSIVFINLAPLIQVRLRLGIRAPLGSGFAVVAGAAVLCFGVGGVCVRWAAGTSTPTFALCLVAGSAAYVALLYRFRNVLLVADLLDAVRGRAQWHEPVPASR
jgi:O-antigen/teichoic acid export membrane protein